MANKALTVNMRIDGMRETLAAFNRLPKEANDSLRARSMELAETLAGRVRSAATSEGQQAALMVATIKARRDRVPVIEAGGTKRVGRNRAPAWKLLFGSEFGAGGRYGWYALPRYASSRGRQYREHLGKQGRWFFPTVRKNEGEIADAWRKVAEDIQRGFTSGG